ncbi:hypothetical protein HU200_013641 [Digitaria exilis]|uniref:F-box domain-containing protein n=1 Tax=Digitaria exilis TaxID=1010633 RepID=A0A835FDA2_9POAL|nr:hypothetical protein HU200_013641 [Digitaria exilis]
MEQQLEGRLAFGLFTSINGEGASLPEDALYEILPRLPAKDLCRLRAVCRPWRSLLSDPNFIAAHAARHPDQPLLVVVGYQACKKNGPVICDVVDLSGRVVKRVHAAGYDDGIRTNDRWVRLVMCTHADLVCVADHGFAMSCQLLNLATGAVHTLPNGVAPKHAAQVQEQATDLSCYDCLWIVFGLVPSIGKYKVLRLVQAVEDSGNDTDMEEEDDLDDPATLDLYEVLTIDGSGQASWRGTQPPPYDLESAYRDSSAVTGGIAYFMLPDDCWDYDGTELGLVGSFDLEREKWRSSIRGPTSGYRATTLKDIKIASLSGHLALCCCRASSSSMDIWFLKDFHKGSWVKQHSIKVSLLHVPNVAQPLLMLNDERIEGHIESWAVLENYIQKIDINKPQMKRYVAVGLYGGNILSLANRILPSS